MSSLRPLAEGEGTEEAMKKKEVNRVLDREGVKTALYVLSGHDSDWRFTGLTGDLWLTYLALTAAKKKRRKP